MFDDEDFVSSLTDWKRHQATVGVSPELLDFAMAKGVSRSLTQPKRARAISLALYNMTLVLPPQEAHAEIACRAADMLMSWHAVGGLVSNSSPKAMGSSAGEHEMPSLWSAACAAVRFYKFEL